MKKMTWKQRITSTISTGFIYVLLLFFLGKYVFNQLYTKENLIFQGVFFGLFFGIGFPFLLEKFGSKLGKNIKPDLLENEIVELETAANLFRGMEGVGGKLFITNKNVLFKSHKFNVQNGQTTITFNDISDLETRKTMKIVDNGLRIVTIDGNHFDFVVNNREDLIAILNSKINLS
ncbi:MAG: GRAM domain-containing protein [Olleya sp.]